ncbi:MAG: hypothetical protein HY094_09825 [Candidatus Melainabacteria bacterium]|nr:hypothetical protein [Candidatus Melainabacteria bacterium]
MSDFNLIVVISLAVLAFFSLCLFAILIPVAMQLSKTLSSVQYLLDTINYFGPEVKDFKETLQSVKSVVQKGTKNIESNVDEAGIFVASSAYGILTGVKEYLSSYKTSENGYNNKTK